MVECGQDDINRQEQTRQGTKMATTPSDPNAGVPHTAKIHLKQPGPHSAASAGTYLSQIHTVAWQQMVTGQWHRHGLGFKDDGRGEVC